MKPYKHSEGNFPRFLLIITFALVALIFIGTIVSALTKDADTKAPARSFADDFKNIYNDPDTNSKAWTRY